MDVLATALAELASALESEGIPALIARCKRIRDVVPRGQDDLADLAEGMISILSDADGIEREILVAQLEGVISGMEMLAAEAAAEATSALPPGLPPWVDAPMLASFADSQRHSLTELEQLLLEPANLGTAGHQRLARLLHTLKGEAGTVGFERIEELYHALEDRLARAGSAAKIVDEALAVKDWMLGATAALAEGKGLPPGLPELLAQLRAPPKHLSPTLTPRSTGPEPKHSLPTDPEVLAMFGEFHDEATESLVSADEVLLSIETAGANAESVDSLFRVFHTIKGVAGFIDLGALGALAHAAEALLQDAREDLSTLSESRLELLLRATSMIRRMLEAIRTAIEQGRSQATVDGFDALLEQLISARNRSSAPPPPRVSAQIQAEEGDEAGPRRQKAASRETLKVDLARVDSLVETIGELVIIEAMVTSATGRVSTVAQRHLGQLSKVVRDLQRQGLALRMVPLKGVFQKMNRLVRDLSRRSGKEIRLDLSGQDAEMDRSLAERLGDPLVHMIRNAVDHGIETREQRRAARKPECATLRLGAYHEGGNIIIELADDGRGLDRDAILRKAIDRGLISASAQPTDREVWDLIFQPGFSTAQAITELSGRGVGMDVVKKTVDELRGRIQISSAKGEGTTFRIVLPLTLAIIDGMLLAVGGRRYVLPTLSIIETLQPEHGQIHRFASTAILDVRGQRLPLVDLGELLGVPSDASADPTSGFIVVIDGIHSRFGLLTDQLIGQQQVVIKQIDPAVNELGLFSGAAILSDGQVGLILNPTALRAEESVGQVSSMEFG